MKKKNVDVFHDSYDDEDEEGGGLGSEPEESLDDIETEETEDE